MNNRLEPSSFRDPAGFVFIKNKLIFRYISLSYSANYEFLLRSGLYQKLVDRKLLISHNEINQNWMGYKDAFKIILPEQIPFISYPYEWSFGQLKAAALTTLAILKHSIEFGMILRDASAYNIQFSKGKPQLIDTTSFGVYREGDPWTAYRQFCQHFLAPLAIMSYTDVRLNQLQRIYIDGIPLDLASNLLPFRSKFNLSLLTHIWMHGWSEKHFVATVPAKRNMSFKALRGLVEHLESGIRCLDWNPRGGMWARYYEDNTYDTEDFEHKKRLVSTFLDDIKCRSVWDLGANLGDFSRIASSKGIQTIAWDADHECVELNFRKVCEASDPNLLPLLLDITNPSPAIGWENTERASLGERGPVDTVLALALIHHLVIANNVPLERIAAYFARLCNTLIIEFVPKNDPGAIKLLAVREDVFQDYHLQSFEMNFEKYFRILRKHVIGSSCRVLFLMSKLEMPSSPCETMLPRKL